MKKSLVVSTLSLALLAGTLVPCYASAASPTVTTQSKRIEIPATNSSSTVQIQSLPSSVLKGVVKNAFRYGGDLLANLLTKVSPNSAKWIRTNANKVADFLDKLTLWQELPIRYALISMGLAPADAHIVASWIVFFIGV